MFVLSWVYYISLLDTAQPASRVLWTGSKLGWCANERYPIPMQRRRDLYPLELRCSSLVGVLLYRLSRFGGEKRV